MKGKFVLVQMASVPEPEENLKKISAFVKEAVETHRPDLLMFPEYCMSVVQPGMIRPAETLDGPFVSGLRELAKTYGVWIVFGMSEQTADSGDSRFYNTTVVLDASGEIVTTYRKTHLYDAFHHRESDATKPGDRLFEPIETPFGKLGLMVCYEVRFPEIARAQKARGAEIILMPTAWAAGKLKSQHYNTLIRARAIENTVFILACDQCHLGAIGESMAVDPMGTALAAAGGEETLVPVQIDTAQIEAVSQILPLYQNRRTELYP